MTEKMRRALLLMFIYGDHLRQYQDGLVRCATTPPKYKGETFLPEYIHWNTVYALSFHNLIYYGLRYGGGAYRVREDGLKTLQSFPEFEWAVSIKTAIEL